MTPAFTRSALNKGIQMKITEFEMRGLLTGKCIPGDMKVNEQLPAYLVRKFSDLHEQLTATTNSLTNAQEALKSAGIEADTVQAGVMEMEDKLRIKQNHIKLRDTYIVELEKRAEDAEAKLAELEKQDSIATLYKDDRGNLFIHRCSDLQHGLTKVFAHPATAIDLNAVRADAVEDVAKRLYGQGYNFEVLTRFADQLRAGNAGKDGSHE